MILAACLLFAVSGYFVVGIEDHPEPGSSVERALEKTQIEEVPAGREPATLVLPTQNEVWDRPLELNRQEESIQTSSGHSWVRLEFNVSTSGEVQQITVIESCLKVSPRDLCIDDDIHDDYAIEQIRMNRYDALGQMEEIVFIPPEY